MSGEVTNKQLENCGHVTRDMALGLVQQLWKPLSEAGYYPGLTGSLLLKGKSKKDMDIIIYPAKAKSSTLDPWLRARTVLSEHGLSMVCECTRECDEKRVEVWVLHGRFRVDVFFLS